MVNILRLQLRLRTFKIHPTLPAFKPATILSRQFLSDPLAIFNRAIETHPSVISGARLRGKRDSRTFLRFISFPLAISRVDDGSSNGRRCLRRESGTM